MNVVVRVYVVLVAIASTLPSVAVAQSGRTWSAQASVLYVGVSGDGFRGVQGGAGIEAQLRYNFPRGFSLGAGFQRSGHSPKSGEPFDGVTLSGIFLEPRFIFGIVGSRAATYGSLRVARLNQSTDFPGGTSDVRATQINAGGGVLIALRPIVNLDLGVTLGTVGFGKVSSTAQRELGRGTNAVLRAGFSWGFGQ